jgi:hypothetical protein
MPNKHYRRWLIQMPLGFLVVSAGVLLLAYADNKKIADQWFLWGAAAAIIINIGLGLLGSAFIHKMKSDLIRKTRKTSSMIPRD